MHAITRHPAPSLINAVITKEYFSSCSNNLQTRNTLLLLFLRPAFHCHTADAASRACVRVFAGRLL